MNSNDTTRSGLNRPGTLDPDRDRRMVVLAAAFLASSLICWSSVCLGPKLTLAITLVPLVLPFMVAYAAMMERGILDPTALFPACFGAYNGLPLIKLLSDDMPQNRAYPVKFEPYIYFEAGLLSALAAIFIAVTWALWRLPPCKKLRKSDLMGWFEMGTGSYILGILLYQVEYLEVGGYWAALAIERTRRFEVMAEKLSLPYFAFVLVGLVMAAAASDTTRKRVATIVMSGLWCVMVMVQGDRRLLLQAVVAVLAAWMFVAARSIRMRTKHLVLAISAYIVLAVAGQLREQIPRIVSDPDARHTVVDSDKNSSLLESVKPGNSELGAPFLSVLYNAEHVREHALGASYFYTLVAIFPRFIYPTKPPSPATEMANDLHRGRFLGFAAAGWGYSPVAEAFLNFGMPGVCIISSLWMGAFIGLSRLRNYTWGLVLAAVLAPETINANRIDFRTVYLEAFSCTVAVLIAALLVGILFKVSSQRVGHRTAKVNMRMSHYPICALDRLEDQSL
jgi:hypothetical protein